MCGFRKGACAQPKESKGRERGITGKNRKVRARAGYATLDPEILTMEKSISNLQSWEHLWFQPSETLENKSLEIWVIRGKKCSNKQGVEQPRVTQHNEHTNLNKSHTLLLLLELAFYWGEMEANMG